MCGCSLQPFGTDTRITHLRACACACLLVVQTPHDFDMARCRGASVRLARVVEPVTAVTAPTHAIGSTRGIGIAAQPMSIAAQPVATHAGRQLDTDSSDGRAQRPPAYCPGARLRCPREPGGSGVGDWACDHGSRHVLACTLPVLPLRRWVPAHSKVLCALCAMRTAACCDRGQRHSLPRRLAISRRRCRASSSTASSSSVATIQAPVLDRPREQVGLPAHSGAHVQRKAEAQRGAGHTHRLVVSRARRQAG